MSKAKFILSKSKVISQYNKVKEYCDVVSYSSKTNQDVTKVLEDNSDAMFSVHFKNELKHIKDKSRVIFLAQAWSYSDIDELISLGIDYFIVDNESDLDILLDYLEKNDVEINLFLRLKLKEYTIRTERYFVFGMGSDVVNRRVKELKNNKKIKKIGIHFHRKTQNMAEWNLKYELSHIIDSDVLDMIDMLNIGGGLPSVYANTNENVVESIFTKIKELREWFKGELIIEPGRFIAAAAVKLETTVVGVDGYNITVNASVYNSDMDAILVPVKLLIKGELAKGDGEAYVVKGITPCSMDLFRYRVYLRDVKVGDKLVFLNAGAYNFTSDFCDLEKIEVEIVE